MKRFVLKWWRDVQCTPLFCHPETQQAHLGVNSSIKVSFSTVCGALSFCLDKISKCFAAGEGHTAVQRLCSESKWKGEVKSIYNALCTQKVIKYVVIVGREAIPALTGQTLNAEHLPIASINKISAVLPFSLSSRSMCFLEQLSAQGKEQRVTLWW